MGQEIAVPKVTIKIGNAEHDVTVQEARALRDALVDLLGDSRNLRQIIPTESDPYFWPTQPRWYYLYGRCCDTSEKNISVSGPGVNQ